MATPEPETIRAALRPEKSSARRRSLPGLTRNLLLRDAHSPQQIAKARVTADHIPDRLVLIKDPNRSFFQATFQPCQGKLLLVQGRIDFGDPVRLAQAGA